MNRLLLAFGLILAAGAAMATDVPSITVHSVAQSADNLVTVDYTLGNELNPTPAIVTVKFKYNNETIDDRYCIEVAGDVNRVIKPGAHKKIFWRPDRSWDGADHPGGAFTAEVKAWSLEYPPPYMVIDARAQEPKLCVKFYASVDLLPEGGLANRELYTKFAIVMRKVQAENIKWRMGATETMRRACGHGITENNNNHAWQEREIPHYVTLTKDYYMGIYPLTQRQARCYWGYTDGSAAAESKPLINISWQRIRGEDIGMDWPTNRAGHTAHDVDAVMTSAPVNKTLLDPLRTRTGLPGLDLPTMAQWELAYRSDDYCGAYASNFYNGENSVTAAMGATETLYGWDKYHANAVQEVGLLAPNGIGLYDMAGNVHEWCLDWFWQKWYTGNPQGTEKVDPPGPTGAETHSSKSVRGGCFAVGFEDQTASVCSYAAPNSATGQIGLRLCCPADMTVLAQ